MEKGSNRLIQSLNKTDIEKVIKYGEIAIKEWKKNFKLILILNSVVNQENYLTALFKLMNYIAIIKTL